MREEVVRTGACSSCGARIIWAVSHKSGKAIPLDADRCPPDALGSFVLLHGRAYSRTVRADALAEHRRTLTTTALVDLPHHLSHFSTCPKADEHRRSR